MTTASTQCTLRVQRLALRAEVRLPSIHHLCTSPNHHVNDELVASPFRINVVSGRRMTATRIPPWSVAERVRPSLTPTHILQLVCAATTAVLIALVGLDVSTPVRALCALFFLLFVPGFTVLSLAWRTALRDMVA